MSSKGVIIRIEKANNEASKSTLKLKMCTPLVVTVSILKQKGPSLGIKIQDLFMLPHEQYHSSTGSFAHQYPEPSWRRSWLDETGGPTQEQAKSC